MVDWKRPNIFLIDSLFSNWKANKISYKTDSVLYEDPFESAFFRWRNRIEPYIIQNGDTSISEYNRILSNYENKTLSDKIDNVKTMTLGNGNWTAVGPSVTYSISSKEYEYGGVPPNSDNVICPSLKDEQVGGKDVTLNVALFANTHSPKLDEIV